jgi:DNA polymerase III delta prime subunit
MTGNVQTAVTGNAEVVRFLTGLAGSSSLGHAYLFCGPDGVGKRLVALEFARAINCRCGKGGGECDSCRLMRSLSHPEVLLLEDLSKPRWLRRSDVSGVTGEAEEVGNGSYGDLIEGVFEKGYIEEPLPRTDRPMAVDGFNLNTDKLFGRGSVPSKECYTPGPVSEEIRKAFDRGDVDEGAYRLLRMLYEYPLSVMPYRGAIPIAYVAARKGWKFTRPIQPFLSVCSMLEGKKIVIIDDAHKMTAEAQNCLLKTLEEPPADSVLLLVTSDRQALFRTIVSRCQVVDFGRLTRPEMEGIARDLMGGGGEETGLLASLSENCPGRFLDLAMHDVRAELEALKTYFSDVAAGRFAAALRLSLGIIEAGGSHRRKQRRTVTEALELAGFWLAQVLRVKAGLPDVLAVPDYESAIAEQADAFERGALLGATECIEEALAVVRFNVDMRLLLDTTFLSIAATLYELR